MGAAPLCLRCPMCKRGESRDDWAVRTSHAGIAATGRERERKARRQIEVVHALCGHKWFTAHPEAVRLSGAA